MILRSLSLITLLFVSGVGPFWLFFVYVILFAFLFGKFNEAIFIAFIADSIFSRPLFHFSFWITVFTIILVLLIERFKRNLI